jgi:hypothetical protein
VFAESWVPLGDGQAPWSRWSAAANGNGRPRLEHGRAA